MKKFLSMVLVLSSFSLSALEVDLQKSTFSWLGKKVTGQHGGLVSLKEAKIEKVKGKLKSAEFVIDLNTITVSDLEGEYLTKFLTHIKSADFFDVAKYPTATLKVKEVKGNKVIGDLTVKGKTGEVIFDVKEEKNGYKGLLKFDRTKFDIVYNSKNFFQNLGDKMINDEVTVDFNVVLK